MPDCLGSSLGLTTYRPMTLGKALHVLAFWFSLTHHGDNFSTLLTLTLPGEPDDTGVGRES